MKLTINGEAKEFPNIGETVGLTDLIENHLGLGDLPVLVELNGVALLKKEIADREVTDGDVLEIIRMVAGG